MTAPFQSDLPVVRRLEAAGFRAWPAEVQRYHGTWLVRLTSHHPAKRLNSVNPLDPADTARLDERIKEAAARFVEWGRPLTFRMSPLAGRSLEEHFDRAGWSRFDESLVMRLPLAEAPLDGAFDQIPLKDVPRFVAAALAVQQAPAEDGPGLAAVIGGIVAEPGLFVVESGGRPVAAAVCVHDFDVAGLFEVATAPEARGQGHGRRLVSSALKWARLRGAREAWLQVEATNAPAVALYRSLGFTEAYRYHYRRPPGTAR